MDRIIEEAITAVAPEWRDIDALKLANTQKVLRAFQETGIGDYHFNDSTGYGYDDPGRDALEAVYTRVFRTESALVRPQLISGTHAISICLFGNLGPGDELISVSGSPYETLQQVIGSKGNAPTALLNQGVVYREVPLSADGTLNWQEISEGITDRTKMVMLQRSRGYSWRPAISVGEIGRLVDIVRKRNPRAMVFVDNCYGEFVEEREPTEVGVDLMAGSLIKNPGGTLAPSGGYVVGREELVTKAADRLTAPGLGMEVGPTFGLTRILLQGLFMAPHVVGEALAGAVLAARVFQDLGFAVSPRPEEKRSDIVQAVKLERPELLQLVCQMVQASSPVDSRVRPVPSSMPGYEHQIIMAAGTFVQGASIEFSADAPMCKPYIAYLQGGSSKEQVILALEKIVAALREKIDVK